MWKAKITRMVSLSGICGVVVIAVSGCGAPSGVVRAPETPLKFTTVGEKRTLTEENPASGLNIPAERKGAATTTNPGNFAVISAGTKPCSLTTDEILNRGESCTIGVEYTVSAKIKGAKFIQEFGPRGEPERLRAEYEIEST
jgi:hypothetical protein